jgi:acetyltransferase-like isoleucine patch superfamily enzyme
MQINEISPAARIHESVVFGPNCREIRIGHGARIHRDIYIDAETLSIGDYVTIHHGTILHGDRISIGHNCWIGHYCILDGHGGELSIGNNVGIGAQSQLWSHMKFGDRLAGCRWHRMESLIVEDDVWFVGHCIVTPIRAEEKSMLMVGGVATKNMLANRVYAGSPARDMTDTFGPQFNEPSEEARLSGFQDLLKEYETAGGNTSWIRVMNGSWPANPEPGVTCFDPIGRRYRPLYSEEESAFMRFCLYDRAKFLPTL